MFPIKEWITLYNHSHILLDQTYAYSQGYNAFEAVAEESGFTGFSKILERIFQTRQRNWN